MCALYLYTCGYIIVYVYVCLIGRMGCTVRPSDWLRENTALPLATMCTFRILIGSIICACFNVYMNILLYASVHMLCRLRKQSDNSTQDNSTQNHMPSKAGLCIIIRRFLSDSFAALLSIPESLSTNQSSCCAIATNHDSASLVPII